MKSLLLRHRHLTAVILLAVVLVTVWFLKSQTAHDWGVSLWSHVDSVHDRLSAAPAWLYFTATGLLPIVGIPMISFYLLSASLYAPHIAILGTVYAIMLNLLVSYAIGRFAQRWVSGLIARTGWKIPQVPPKHHIWLTAAIRVTPGAPLMVQNYLLVLAGVPLSIFVLVSLPLEMLIAAGYVLLGHSVFTGNWKMLLVGVAVVAAAVLVFRFIRKRSEQKKKQFGLKNSATAQIGVTAEADSAQSTGTEGGGNAAGKNQ